EPAADIQRCAADAGSSCRSAASLALHRVSRVRLARHTKIAGRGADRRFALGRRVHASATRAPGPTSPVDAPACDRHVSGRRARCEAAVCEDAGSDDAAAARDASSPAPPERIRVQEMLSAMGGSTPPSGLAKAVFRETEGNPFFVEEVYQHLTEE